MPHYGHTRWSGLPLEHQSLSTTFNLDGLIRHWAVDASSKVGYVQAFRSGPVEVVDTALLDRGSETGPILAPSVLERSILEAATGFFQFFDLLDAGYPVAVMLSILGVKDFVFWRSPHDAAMYREKRKIRNSDLVLPSVVTESRPDNPAAVLRPVFDALWNAGGFPGSPNYDEDGNWVGRD